MFSQVATVKGIVTDNKGLSCPGVTVVVKGKISNATITDVDGVYLISDIAKSDTLVFSFIGMESQEVLVNGQTLINVVLDEQALQLDEVMVVAYGKATKNSFTGSAAKVDGEKLAKKNAVEITNALKGEVAGLQVINSTGQPGSSSAIRIRGFGSVNAGRAPLYVVDGIPFSGDLSSIAPSDIASTTVLKDATATALYGSRGANGVILITTKRGKNGESLIEVDVKQGVNMRLLPLYNSIESPEIYTELVWEGLYNRYEIDPSLPEHTEMESREWASQDLFSDYGMDPYYNLWNVEGKNVIDPTTGKMNPSILRRYNPSKWADEMFRNGKKTEATIKLSGGADNINYFTSIGFINDEGYYMESDYQRLSVRSNVGFTPRTWLRGNVGLSYAYSDRNYPGQSGSANNGFNFVNNVPPIYSVFVHDDEGYILDDDLLGGKQYDYGFGTDRARGFSPNINPAGATQLDISNSISHQLSANANFEAKINKNLKFSTNFGTQVLASVGSGLTNMFYGDAEGIGRISKSNGLNLSYTWNQILSWGRSYGSHNVDAFIAHENTLTQNSSLYGNTSMIASPFSVELSNGIRKDGLGSSTDEYALESYFGQLKYDYDETYFLHLTVRRDGTSRFPNDKWGTFGSAGFAWMLSRESFLKDVSQINSLKYKISYGVLGNQNLGVYPTFDSYSIDNLNDYLSISFSGKGNPNLTWENSKNFNTGFESRFFKRYTLDVEYFRKLTDNMLYYKQVAPSLGFASYPVNDGRLVNSGIEFNVSALIVDQAFKFSVGLNGAKYNNRMLTMPLDDVTGKEKPIEINGAYAYAKDRSLYDFYMREWAGVDPETGQANWNRYYNILPNGSKEYIEDMATYESENTIHELGYEKTDDYTVATKKFLDKSVIPTIAGGLSMNFIYKNLSLDLQFTYNIGGYSYDNIYAGLMADYAPGANNWHEDILNRWQTPGDVTDVPRLSSDYDLYAAAGSSRFIISNNNLNLTNARLAYNVSPDLLQKIGVYGLNLWVSGNNLFLISKRKGFIPNTSESGNSNSYNYTPLSSVTMGFNIQF